MLVLTRKPGETVVVDDKGRKIVINLLKTQGKSVSIGIDAPSDMRIYRGELEEEVNARTARGGGQKQAPKARVKPEDLAVKSKPSDGKPLTVGVRSSTE